MPKLLLNPKTPSDHLPIEMIKLMIKNYKLNKKLYYDGIDLAIGVHC